MKHVKYLKGTLLGVMTLNSSTIQVSQDSPLTTSRRVLSLLLIDLARITGAYLAGLLVAMSSSTSKIKDSISTIGYSIFIPMFFVSIGIRMDLTGIQNVLIFSLSYTIIAFITKITGSGIGALLSGYGKFDSLKVGIGMLPRMEVALVIVSAGVSENVISKSLFTATIVMVLITTVITPILLKRTYQIS